MIGAAPARRDSEQLGFAVDAARRGWSHRRRSAMTEPIEPSGTVDLPPPVPAPPRKRRTWRFWLIVAGSTMVVLCGAGALLIANAAKEWIDIARAPESERAALVSKTLGEMAKGQVEASDRYLAAIDDERDDDAWAMGSAAFQGSTTREKFGETAALVRSVVGRCRSHEMRSFNTNVALGGATSCTLQFAAHFDKGDGTITMELESVGGDWKVRTWRTNSPLFDEAMKRGAGK